MQGKNRLKTVERPPTGFTLSPLCVCAVAYSNPPIPLFPPPSLSLPLPPSLRLFRPTLSSHERTLSLIAAATKRNVSDGFWVPLYCTSELYVRHSSRDIKLSVIRARARARKSHRRHLISRARRVLIYLSRQVIIVVASNLHRRSLKRRNVAISMR